jgi:protein-L-isoaspartate(D-aspartate) O-methyltransferase
MIVTAAVPQVPEPLAEQLEEGGVIVAPVGAGDLQELIVGRKQAGSIQQMSVCGVRFVNLRGEYGFPE